MKQRIIGKLMLLCLTVVMASACSKEESDWPQSNIHGVVNDADGMHVARYEAQWVVDKQVSDHTVLTVNVTGNFFSLSQLPMEHLLVPILPVEEREEPITQLTVSDWRFVMYAYSNTVTYIEAESNSQWSQCAVKVGEKSYNLCIHATFYSTHDMSRDVWSIRWDIEEISLRDPYAGRPGDEEVHHFDPALNLTLVTTNRLN